MAEHREGARLAWAGQIEPGTTALLVVDVQNDFVDERGTSTALGADTGAARRAVEQINRLIHAARAVGVPVAYLRLEHSPRTDRPNYKARYRERNLDPDDLLCATGSWGADWYAGLLMPRPGEAVVTKYGYDGFQDTALDAILQNRGARSLVVTGVVTNLCVQTTAEHGFALGYHVVIVTDATAGDDDDAHRSALRNLGIYFGFLVKTEEIIGVWQASTGPAPPQRLPGDLQPPTVASGDASTGDP